MGDARDAYDALPYGSMVVPHAHPEPLAIAAMRRGLSPAPPDRSRILELGCAEGGNAIPLAYYLPDCEVVAVDSSAVQIELADARRRELGLGNLSLRHADILELTDELGAFDYVLCHGVYSWVAEPVRERILELFRDLLAPSGVALLSYNCAPGWALSSLIRRAAMTRTKATLDPHERVAQLREVLGWFVDSPLRGTPRGALLAEQAKILRGERDGYLMSEYLGTENQAFQFGEIIERARVHDLAFLCELNRASSANGEDEMRASLSFAVDDWVVVEELSEIFSFRAFRSSLFVHREALERAAAPLLDLEPRLRFAATMLPESAAPSLAPGAREIFETTTGDRAAMSDPLLKASILELSSVWPRSLLYEELVEAAIERAELAGVTDAASSLGELRASLLDLERRRYLTLRLLERVFAELAGARPRVGELTRHDAARGPDVVTPHHTMIRLDEFTRGLVGLLDGTRDRAALRAGVDGRDTGGGSLEDRIERALLTLAVVGLLEA